MKNLYHKGKGKIHPSPSSSSSSSSPSSIPNLLPPAIRSLVSNLPPEDLEVLGYLIKTTHPTSKDCKKSSPFDCSCFDCYTTFWSRWNSSANSKLIHQALEAFEESHLPNAPKPSKKKERRILTDKSKKLPVSADKSKKAAVSGAKTGTAEVGDERLLQGATADDVPDVGASISGVSGVMMEVDRVSVPESDASEGGVVLPQLPDRSNQQGLVRKIWPDVLGLFNSRLWGLWSPNF